jgi:cytochrome c peroxidase
LKRTLDKVNHFEEFRTLDEDPGRYLITKEEEDWRAFRTPTLRDVSRTGPYMHNGIFETLEETIEFHDRGEAEALTPLHLTGQEKKDLTLEETIEFHDRGESEALTPLHLTGQEKKDLALFLEEALTGEEIVVRTPRVP